MRMSGWVSGFMGSRWSVSWSRGWCGGVLIEVLAWCGGVLVKGEARGTGRPRGSHVPRQTQAGEDLAAHGQVPVAERHGGHARVARPRAATQHAIVGAEEDL